MAGAISPVALGNVNDVPYVMDISHGNQFSWQVPYLVMLQCHFSWQAQCLVKSG